MQFTFSPPAGLDEAQVPIWSGFLRVISTTDQDFGSVVVPYFGVAADLGSQSTLALEPSLSGNLYPALGDATNALVYNDSTTYSLVTAADGSVDAPSALIRLRLGTEHLTVDLIKASTTYKPTVAINDPKSPPAQRRDLLNRKQQQHRRGAHSDVHAPHLRAVKRGSGTYDDIDIVGNVYSGSSGRGSNRGNRREVQLANTVTGGKDGRTIIPVADGEYRFLVRVLKLFRNDWTDNDNYETYLSHAFTIKNAPANTTTAATPPPAAP